MDKFESMIKDFVKEQGVEVAGIAGPDRLSGPPSLDPTYVMPGAKSIISLALPMNVDAIYKFLGKKSPAPHGLDQLQGNQRIFRISEFVAGFIRSKGYNAVAVPPNNIYRRNLDAFANIPNFSHRFGALAAGIAAQGWSGNVMTEEYGAAIWLDTVVTDAVLQSDKPRYSSRHFIDNYCLKCRTCEKTCVAGMFEPHAEEYVLLNGELHPRGKRRDINLCNASCFGLHSLSRDKKWTTWGYHWIDKWIENPPEVTRRGEIKIDLFKAGSATGDSTPRYDLIRRSGSMLWPEDFITGYVQSHSEVPSEEERMARFPAYAERMGVKGLKDDRILTCGHCAIVCGPTVEESQNRYHLLTESGLVVLGPNGKMVHVDTYEEAVTIRQQNPLQVTKLEMLADAWASTVLFHKFYFGVEPKSIIGGVAYDRKLKKAVRAKIRGHKEAGN